MPIIVRKLQNQNCYRVFNDKTKTIHSKCSSLGNAKSQQRLLNAVDRGWRPTGGMVMETLDPRALWEEGWREYEIERRAYEKGLDVGVKIPYLTYMNRAQSRLRKIVDNLKKVENPNDDEIRVLESYNTGGKEGLIQALMNIRPV